MEVWRYLDAADCGRCMLACKDWQDKAGDAGVWSEYLDRYYALPRFDSQLPNPRQEYSRLARACRNVQRLSESNVLVTSTPASPGTDDLLSLSSSLLRFHGHEKSVLAILVDEAHDR